MNTRTRGGEMTQYLVEAYVGRAKARLVSEAASRARTAARELTGEGTPVRYLRSIYVPDDETCFYLFEAGSAEIVAEAAGRAAIDFARISEALDGRGPR